MARASEFLLTQFHSRKLKNPRYSLRAFASYLGINSGRLSQYFSGQREISPRAAKIISEKLHLDPAETNYFFHLIEQDKGEKKTVGSLLKDDQIALVVEWYHAALLALLSTKDFDSDPKWIAERLQLPVEVVESSVERLQRIELLENGRTGLRRKPGPVRTSSGVPSEFLRLSHKDILKKVIADLDTVSIDHRDVTSITFPMDIKNIPAAKKMIELFRIKMAKRFSKGTKNEVMALNVQLFPLTKVR
ncbi:hypothetical protein D3C87_1139990 [compost metagenome]